MVVMVKLLVKKCPRMRNWDNLEEEAWFSLVKSAAV